MSPPIGKRNAMISRILFRHEGLDTTISALDSASIGLLAHANRCEVHRLVYYRSSQQRLFQDTDLWRRNGEGRRSERESPANMSRHPVIDIKATGSSTTNAAVKSDTSGVK